MPPTFDAHKNFAVSTVATAPSPPTTGTTVTLQSGDGAAFPTAPFNATISPIGALPTRSTSEIVRVTAIGGDTLTITRAQEGSTARSVGVGDLIAATVTAKLLTDLETPFSTIAYANAVNTWTVGAGAINRQSFEGTLTQLTFKDLGQAAGSRVFDVLNYNQSLFVRALSDDFSTVGATVLQLTRAGDALIGRDVYEKGRTTPIGHWQSVGYNGANFTAAPSGSWTVDAGDQSIVQYTLVGKTLIVILVLVNTSISGSPVSLAMVVPGGFTAAVNAYQPVHYSLDTAATWAVGSCVCNANQLLFRRDPTGATAWPATATNQVYLFATVSVPIS